jgi:hypothetical protein
VAHALPCFYCSGRDEVRICEHARPHQEKCHPDE